MTTQTAHKQPAGQGLETRLTTYAKAATAVAATASAIGIGTNADADVVFFDPDSVSITGPGRHQLFIDVNEGVVNTTDFDGADFALDLLSYTGGYGFRSQGRIRLFRQEDNEFLVSFFSETAYRFYSVARLGSDVSVGTPNQMGSSGTFFAFTNFSTNDNPDSPVTVTNNLAKYIGGYGFSYGNWLGLGTGFLGLKFDVDGNTHFGWLNITLGPSANPRDRLVVTLNSFAYEDEPNTPIVTTIPALIPEPSSLALLSLGAIGLAAFRRLGRGKKPEIVTYD